MTFLSKKKKKGRFIVLVIAAIATVATIGFALTRGSGSASANSPVMSSTVERGSIRATIAGTGALSNETSKEIEIPAGLDATEILVKTGDKISAGDSLAVFDGRSVRNSLSEVQGAIEELDSKIEDVKNDTEPTSLNSGVSGRVKAIYAVEGDDVGARVSQSGALMILSLDGKMAVDIEVSGFYAGESVTVALADGTVIKGSVERVGSPCIITITDNGPSIGEQVTITDSNGNEAGTGILYVNSPLPVIGYYGTVESVQVSENSYVYSGTKLLTLKDVGVSNECKAYLEERAELLEVLGVLIDLSQNGGILKAEFSGIVTELGLTQDGESTVTNTADNSVNGMDYSNYGFVGDSFEEEKVMLLTNELAQIDSIDGLEIAFPETGASPQSSITAEMYSGEAIWTPSDEVFAAETVYTADVHLTSDPGYIFASDINISLPGCEISEINNIDGYTLSFSIVFPATKAEKTDEEESTTPDGNVSQGGQSAGYGGSAGIGGYSPNGGSNTGAYNTGSVSSTTQDNAADPSMMACAFKVSPGENMLITVNIDELDILSIEVGQDAEISLDALEDKSFSGVVTRINYAPNASNGVTKYSAEITITKSEEMLEGMNASVTIIIDEKTDILVLPSQAIGTMSGKSYVNISQDENGVPSEAVFVDTGISDGNYVEILNGLDEGDRVYFIARSASESDSTNMIMGMGPMRRGATVTTGGTRAQGADQG